MPGAYQPRQGHAVPKASHWGGLCIDAERVDVLAAGAGGSVHVRGHIGHVGPRDAPALVGNLDRNVRLTPDKNYPDRRGRFVIVVVLMPLDNGPHAVLEQLKQDMVEMRGNVRETLAACMRRGLSNDVPRADPVFMLAHELHRRDMDRLEHSKQRKSRLGWLPLTCAARYASSITSLTWQCSSIKPIMDPSVSGLQRYTLCHVPS